MGLLFPLSTADEFKKYMGFIYDVLSEQGVKDRKRTTMGRDEFMNKVMGIANKYILQKSQNAHFKSLASELVCAQIKAGVYEEGEDTSIKDPKHELGLLGKDRED
jgi:hypothetical protein